MEPILTSREKAGAVSGEFHHCHLKGTLGLFGQKNKVYFGVGIHIDIYMYMYTYIYDDMYIAIYIYIQLAGFHAINASMVILRMAMMAWQHGHPNPAKDFTQYLHGVSKSLPLNRNIMPPTMNLDKLLHIFFIDSPTEIYKQITNPYL